MNIKRVKYKMSKDGKWEKGYAIGMYDGSCRTLLNKDFEYVEKVKHKDGEKYICYDMKDDVENRLNITID